MAKLETNQNSKFETFCFVSSSTLTEEFGLDCFQDLLIQFWVIQWIR